MAIIDLIRAFVDELVAAGFGQHQRSIALYNRLLSKTKDTDEEMIERHVSAFRNFSVQNKHAIAQKNAKLFELERISYNDKVFINMRPVIKHAAPENVDIIWAHLTNIASKFDNSREIHDALNRIKSHTDDDRSASDTSATGDSEQPSSSTDEDMAAILQMAGPNSQIIEEIVGMIQTKIVIDDTKSPDEVVGGIVQSDVFGEIMKKVSTEMDEGRLDVGALLSTAQSLMGGSAGGGAGNMMSMLGPMMQTVQQAAQSNGMVDREMPQITPEIMNAFLKTQ